MKTCTGRCGTPVATTHLVTPRGERRIRLWLLGLAVLVFAAVYANTLLSRARTPDPGRHPQHETGTPPVPSPHPAPEWRA